MNIVNLWFDDERPATDGWTHCRTVGEAISVMQTCVVVNASLDHDLGTSETGYDFAMWMAGNETWPQNKPTVHSMNPVGRTNIESVIERYYPATGAPISGDLQEGDILLTIDHDAALPDGSVVRLPAGTKLRQVKHEKDG